MIVRRREAPGAVLFSHLFAVLLRLLQTHNNETDRNHLLRPVHQRNALGETLGRERIGRGESIEARRILSVSCVP